MADHEHENEGLESEPKTAFDDILNDDSLTPDERLDKIVDEYEEVERTKSPEADNTGKPDNPDSGGSPDRVTGGSTGTTGTGGTTGASPRGGSS